MATFDDFENFWNDFLIVLFRMSRTQLHISTTRIACSRTHFNFAHE